MKPLMSFLFIVSLISMILLLLQSSPVISVTCRVAELSPCAGPILAGNSTIPAQCCSKLKEQQPCLCQYKKNPAYSAFVNSPNAKKVAKSCGVSIPSC
ncbi:Bifunctional inhibitor/lipid-transfer protein/seed storage 2S albumin protein [Dioscorea alata]|uniref:Bifunctional inhibitor/lipid-transfer protein/seed storage 2S albumin protein n=1 Tax=Dioscorea alata TaxID=55571 RepID=A0ACB7UDM8_DIOAL|nr:Bifunctional inhibitor/lipid-transfer protein/seed storage 2S albumin protein [Dioscorea alata]